MGRSAIATSVTSPAFLRERTAGARPPQVRGQIPHPPICHTVYAERLNPMDQPIEIEGSHTHPPSLARDEFAAKLDFTIDRAQRALIAIQHDEGYWYGSLNANAEMNAEFIIFNHFMEAVDLELEVRLKNHLLETQQSDGSWNLY